MYTNTCVIRYMSGVIFLCKHNNITGEFKSLNGSYINEFTSL